MQRIKIYENDNTFNVVRDVTNVSSVLIPGFATQVDKDGTQAPVGEIIECNTITEFMQYFGNTPPIILPDANVFPKKGEVQPVDTVKTCEDMYLKYNTEATFYNQETEYVEGNQCIYGTTDKDSALWYATGATTGEWDPTKWVTILVPGDYITVEEDEDHAQGGIKPRTQYLYKISSLVGKLEYKAIPTAGFPDKAIPIGDELGTKDKVPMFPKAKDNNVYDPSWVMAYTLLKAGLSVAYVRMNTYFDTSDKKYDVSPAAAYDYMHNYLFKMPNRFGALLDKNLNIAFITSGGYPVLEHSYNIADLMVQIATMTGTEETATFADGRGDCVVLLDHTNNPQRPLTGTDSVFESAVLEKTNYAAIFTPWIKTSIDKLQEAPATFAYLYALAEKGGADTAWNSVAGISRGRCTIVDKLNTDKTLTNKIAEYYQNDFDDTTTNKPISINPITYIRNYGYCLWGDRTCERYINGEKGLALSFLHVRNLVSAIKKKVYLTSQELMFEVNNELLWTKFKSKVSVLLDEMVAAKLISDYAFTRIAPSNDQTVLYATLTIYPTYSLEKVEITVNLENDADAVITEDLN